MPKTIRVGVLTQATGPHLGEYFASLAATPEADWDAVADPSGECREQANKLLGDKLVGFFDSHAGLLREFKPTMALVACEPKLTPPAIAAALDAGCHILSEKPACVRHKDFADLVATAETKHRLLMLALCNRLHDPVQEARRLVQDGKLGRLFAMNLFLVADQARLTRPDYRESWRGSKARAGGAIWHGWGFTGSISPATSRG